MKRIALILVAIAAAVMLTGGLATPVQASTERSCRIGQNRIVKTANMAALTRKAFDRAAKLAVAHDPTFKAFVFGSGQFLPLKVGERARVVYVDWGHVEVYLFDWQTHVWIACSWLR